MFFCVNMLIYRYECFLNITNINQFDDYYIVELVRQNK